VPDLSAVRVAWVTPVLGYGGNLMYWSALLDAFSRPFGAFRVFTSGAPGTTSSGGIEIERCGFSRRVYSGDTPAKTASYGSSISFASPRLLARLIRYKPDLVVTAEFGPYSVYSLAYAKFLRPGARSLLAVENRPWATRDSLPGKFRVFLRRRVASLADAVLTNNEAGASYLTETLGVAPERMVTKPFLVSVSPAWSAEGQPKRPPEDGRTRFLFVGQLIPRKGLQHALEAFGGLLPRYAGRFSLDVVGEGPERSALEARAGELGLEEHVMFHGSRAFDDMGQFYRESHVFLFPTLSDYRALAPFEAMAAGMPILCSIHNGGLAEVVAEGENGFSFDPRDAGSVGGLLARLIDDPGLIPRFSECSLRMAAPYSLANATGAVVEAASLALSARGRAAKRSGR
jgi:glycosyltransferase involved in cell wall biosynthesis